MSSACYVYAIVRRHTPLPSAGIAGAAELSLVPCGELAAVTGRMGGDGASVTVEAVVHHEAVVEAVRRQGPALPVRFGTVFRDAAAVAAALAERYEPLAADLDRLGDKVELSLTVLWATPSAAHSSGDGPPPAPRDDDAPAAPGSGQGARYLRARAAEHLRDAALKERARAVGRELERVLGGLALERRLSLLPSPRIAVRATWLLDPATVSAFRAAAETFRRTHEELRVLLTGPWPPYTFARQEAEAGSGAEGHLAGLVQLLTDEVRGRPG